MRTILVAHRSRSPFLHCAPSHAAKHPHVALPQANLSKPQNKAFFYTTLDIPNPAVIPKRENRCELGTPNSAFSSGDVRLGVLSLTSILTFVWYSPAWPLGKGLSAIARIIGRYYSQESDMIHQESWKEKYSLKKEGTVQDKLLY